MLVWPLAVMCWASSFVQQDWYLADPDENQLAVGKRADGHLQTANSDLAQQ